MTGGAPGPVLRDRPFIDDSPARKYGWEAFSRWGSRPLREFGRLLARLRKRLGSKASAALLVGAGLASLESCAGAKAVVVAPTVIDQVRLGFGLNQGGQVSPGCTARSFLLRDPIHLSMQVSNAAAGSILHVSVRDIVTHRVAWSEARPVTPGRSLQTFEIGRKLAAGGYRAESTLGGAPTNPRDFVVRDRREAVR